MSAAEVVILAVRLVAAALIAVGSVSFGASILFWARRAGSSVLLHRRILTLVAITAITNGLSEVVRIAHLLLSAPGVLALSRLVTAFAVTWLVVECIRSRREMIALADSIKLVERRDGF